MIETNGIFHISFYIFNILFSRNLIISTFKSFLIIKFMLFFPALQETAQKDLFNSTRYKRTIKKTFGKNQVISIYSPVFSLIFGVFLPDSDEQKKPLGLTALRKQTFYTAPRSFL